VGFYGCGGIVSLASEDRLRLGLGEIEVLRHGRGRPILLIHGINPVSPQAPFLEGLADHGEIVAPSAPGFGHSPRPTDFDTMYDLIHLYREVLDALPGETVLIGFSFGGWIAAEIAVAGSPKIDRLVLVDPVGIKIGGREERDIVHFFNTAPEELNRRSWHDPARRPSGCWGLGWQADIDEAMSDEDMIVLARSWDALCLYAWRPHMYNPQLKHWLHRISVPTLVLWGAGDRIVTPGYGRAYADLIPGARFEIIEGAGHHPELEQPRAFVDAVANFLDAS
jgi:pimeloyl-ACP methyl ester carboxylesterase